MKPKLATKTSPIAKTHRRAATYWVWVTALAAVLGAGPAYSKTPDVRIVIDISGSMKKTDPDNLRVPALRLLVDLVPNGALAGVWTFGRFVNMQVPLKPVDKGWRSQALAHSGKIHSRGLFTDIEIALSRVAKGWKQPSPTHDRHLILLTDGVVDVPEGEEGSNMSRAQILERVLPRLKAAGARVHTVGLSEYADRGLLRELAAATQGQYMEVTDPGSLQRVFLRLFEQTTPRDAVPLVDNQFSVDASVKELTLVVFRASADSPTTHVIDPEGTRFNSDNAPDNVRWRSDEGYDLITIEAPATGKWGIDAEVDPDNRVMIITDLKLHTSELPAFVLPGDAVALEAHLTEKGKPVTRQGFLDTLTFLASPIPMDNDAASPRTLEMQPSDEGRFKLDNLSSALKQGIFDVVTRVDGGTFVRERRHRLNVQWPVTATFERNGSNDQPIDGATSAGSLVVKLAEGFVKGESINVSAALMTPSGNELPLELTATDDLTLVTTIPKSEETGIQYIHVRAQGKTTMGRPFDVVLDPLKTGTERKPEPEPPTPSTIEEPPKADSAHPNWQMTLLITAAINLIAGAVAFGLWFWRRKRAESELNELLGAV